MNEKTIIASDIVASSTPAKAEAITWGEFWEPFKPDEVHYHYERPKERERA